MISYELTEELKHAKKYAFDTREVLEELDPVTVYGQLRTMIYGSTHPERREIYLKLGDILDLLQGYDPSTRPWNNGECSRDWGFPGLVDEEASI